MTGTFWAILPPVIAIVLALITKEVYLFADDRNCIGGPDVS